MKAVFILTLLMFLTSCYNYYRMCVFRARYQFAKRIASMAIDLASKHEAVMSEAGKVIRSLTTMSEKIGCDVEAVKFRTLATQLQLGVGMAKKLEVL